MSKNSFVAEVTFKRLMSIDLLALMTSWVSGKSDYLMDNEKKSFPTLMAEFGWVCPFLAGCGWVWPFMGWVWVSVSFFWLGVAEYDLYLGGCGWIWVSVTFSWLDMGKCDLFFLLAVCDLFLAGWGGCGWEHSLQLPAFSLLFGCYMANFGPL